MQPENAAHRWHSGEVTDDTPFNERPTAVINEFNDEVAREFRANGGEVGGQFAGVPILLLTNTGAKSGQQRLNPLAYFNIDGKIYIVGSFGGADKDPAWVYNLRANPDAHIDIGTDGYDVVAHELSLAERDALYPKVVELVPVFAEYQEKTARPIPIFELRRT
ncbi:Deazaflavin-dependent nitroreductase [Mycobacteroides abscessus subsp. abscessus]|nr:Deazaflavin-dependent nitroreductase [Mycobacteroides abscessus subsp. abscessus]SHZ33720.1 Deazaflavin-dependent nitroreductase [Mycobacteroides abscessus subsp. abscessus]SIF62911.1 Deazaflavin-dependent nitroreductase [Mycobacteroides abscessus subsp. abscessus]